MLNPKKATETMASVGRRMGGEFNEKVLTELYRLCRARGWAPRPPVAHLGRGGADLTASVLVPGVAGHESGNFPAVGVATGRTDRPRRLTLYCGAATAGGGAVVSGAWGASKYGPAFDVTDELTAGLDWFAGESARFLHKDVPRLQVRRVSRERYNELMLVAGRRGMIPHSRVFRADAELEGRDVTAWEILTAFGRAAARNTPVGLFDNLLRFYKVVTGETPVKESV